MRYISFFFFLFFLSFIQAQENLKVAPIFSDGMVLQRNQEITIWGMANPNEKITIRFKSISVFTNSNGDGKWSAIIPSQDVGIPFEIKINTQSETIILDDILVGEVWLASGQSNMHLDLKRTLNGEEVAKKANNPNIRIYNMRPTYPTGKGGVHTKEELEKIQNNKYFNTKGWVKVTPENVLYFSAVAYYFAEKLQGELNIPIGIIHNAVPGSPIESWLPKEIIEQDATISNLVAERWRDKKDEKDGMITVANNQISLKKITSQKHPWMPSYNYINGIVPIKKYRFKGVIWYQGESNAEQTDVYKAMFKMMVKTWRSDFKNDFPFYFVQLTSREDRPAWSEFRNVQRELLDEVSNSKMVVITDVGDRQDTHAKNKKPVGDRLAILALGNTYKKGSNYESPIFDTIIFKDGDYYVSFKGCFKGLKTIDGKEIVGFEISKDNINFENITPTVQGNFVKFKLPQIFENQFFIRYAWEPYTEANLISGNGLPVSTFKATF